jgi:multiple sugar transport system substrate-binding protein
MSSSVTLRGITWNHSRGFSPMAATAQRFNELHPGIKIVWEKHSLKTFEDSPVERLALDYDLMVLDHPCIRKAVPSGTLLPLDEHLAPAFLADQAAQTVGRSHVSYQRGGHQWALAIDAAAPVAFWRGDLLARLERTAPSTWEELLALARGGQVEVPAAPINCLMNFYTLCLASGEALFLTPGVVASRAAGLAALAQLRELLVLCDPGCWTRNPIASLDLMAAAANQKIVYCPLAYGYSNYARTGYADHRLDFGEAPLVAGQPLRTTLGGAGLSVSALRGHRREVLAYTEFVASSAVQRTLYTQSGGQPGHRAGWLDAENNRLTNDYFIRTLPVLDRAYLRPQFTGYMHFQKRGALIVHAALRGTLPDAEALAHLDALYRNSRLDTPAAA